MHYVVVNGSAESEVESRMVNLDAFDTVEVEHAYPGAWLRDPDAEHEKGERLVDVKLRSMHDRRRDLKLAGPVRMEEAQAFVRNLFIERPGPDRDGVDTPLPPPVESMVREDMF